MKKLLIAALLFSGFAIFAPRAEAGSYRTHVIGYDRYGYPIHRQVVTRGYCEPRSSYHYRAPVYYRSTSYRSYDYGRHYDSRSYRSYSNSRDCRTSSRPRFAVSFGF